jgi:hypothetical protein
MKVASNGISAQHPLSRIGSPLLLHVVLLWAPPESNRVLVFLCLITGYQEWAIICFKRLEREVFAEPVLQSASTAICICQEVVSPMMARWSHWPALGSAQD